MNANDREQALLKAAGFDYEYPGYWQRVEHGMIITIADGLSCNGFMWEVQINMEDDTQVASEGFPTVQVALAMVAREIATPGSSYVASDMNKNRAEWAHSAVETFAKATRMDHEDDDTIIGDLLGDLLHYCAQHGLDFDALRERGRGHFEAERLGAE